MPDLLIEIVPNGLIRFSARTCERFWGKLHAPVSLGKASYTESPKKEKKKDHADYEYACFFEA